MPARNPEERAAYESARKRSEQVLLRFTADEAQRVRAAAGGAGLALADFVLAAVDGQPRPLVDLGEVAALSSAVAALAAAPRAVRDLEADLGRLSGRLSHLFTVNYERASLHREEIHATLDEVRDVLRRVVPEVAALRSATAPARAEIGEVMRTVAHTLEGVS